MYSCPSISPASWIGTTFGCSSEAATRDSRQEALAERHVVGELRREQLQRDVSIEREVVRPVDDAHPAAAHQRLDAIAGELLADTRVR